MAEYIVRERIVMADTGVMYHPGDVVELDPGRAQALVERGVLEPVRDEERKEDDDGD